MQPRVSVIFPVHSRQAYLREAIESILRQTMADLELLVIEDGHFPAVATLLDDYTDPRIRRIRFPLNMGVSTARNAGLASARAPYIAMMDSDDEADPRRLATQLAWMDAHPEVTACGTHAVKLLPDGRRLPMAYPQDDGHIKARLWWVDGALLNPTVLLRTDFVRQRGIFFDPNLPRDEDHAFYVAMMKAGARFQAIPEPLFLYRRHAENITNEVSRIDDEKTAVRVRLLPLFFPQLTGVEGQFVLHLMRHRPALSAHDMWTAVALAEKAMRETRSFYGEDRREINSLLHWGTRRALTRYAPVPRAAPAPDAG